MNRTKQQAGLQWVLATGLLLLALLCFPLTAEAATAVTTVAELEAAQDAGEKDFTFSGTAEWMGRVTIEDGQTLTILEGASLTYAAYGPSSMTIAEGGTLQIETAGSLLTHGPLVNEGSFINNGSWTIPRSSAFSTNNGTLINDSSLMIEDGAALNNNSTLINNGTIQNDGNIYQTINGTISGTGTVSGTGRLIHKVHNEAELKQVVENAPINGTPTYISWDDSITMSITDTLTIQAGQWIEFEGMWCSITGSGLLQNNGTLVLNAQIISEGTLINNGTLKQDGSVDLQVGSHTENNGTWTNNVTTYQSYNATFINNGTLHGTGSWEIVVTTEEELKNVIATAPTDGTSTSIWIANDITVTGDLTIAAGQNIVLSGQELVITGNLTNNGSLLIDNTLTVNGSLLNNGILGKTHSGSITGTIEGTGTYYPNTATHSSALRELINAAPTDGTEQVIWVVNDVPLSSFDSGDITIQARQNIKLVGDATITTVDRTLTNNGTLTLSEGVALQNDYAFVNSGIFAFGADGDFTGTGTFENTTTGVVQYPIIYLGGVTINGIPIDPNSTTVSYNSDSLPTLVGQVPLPTALGLGDSFAISDSIATVIEWRQAGQTVTEVVPSATDYSYLVHLEGALQDGTLMLTSAERSLTMNPMSLSLSLADSVTVDYTAKSIYNDLPIFTINEDVGDDDVRVVAQTQTVFPSAASGSYDKVDTTIMADTVTLTGADADKYSISSMTGKVIATHKGVINQPKALPIGTTQGYVFGQEPATVALQPAMIDNAYYEQLKALYGSDFTTLYPTGTAFSDAMVTISDSAKQAGAINGDWFDLSINGAEALWITDVVGTRYYQVMVPELMGLTADLMKNIYHLNPMTGEVETLQQVSADTIPQLGQYRVLAGVGMELAVSHNSPLFVAHNLPEPTPSTPSGTVSGSTSSTPLVGPNTGDNGMTGMLVLVSTLALSGILLTVRMRKTK